LRPARVDHMLVCNDTLSVAEVVFEGSGRSLIQSTAPKMAWTY
jgi:hypothetical protein